LFTLIKFNILCFFYSFFLYIFLVRQVRFVLSKLSQSALIGQMAQFVVIGYTLVDVLKPKRLFQLQTLSQHLIHSYTNDGIGFSVSIPVRVLIFLK